MDIHKLISKEWIVEERTNSIKVWFLAKRGNQCRKSFIFPKEIAIDTSFAEAAGMILGDGDFHRKEKCHFTYASIDLDMIAFILKFFREKILVDTKDMSFTVYYRDFCFDKRMLSEMLDIPKNKIKMHFSERHRNPVIHLQINGVVFRDVFERIIKTFSVSYFISNDDLRRGFIRGLFAAEGCVGIKYKEKYINQIEFTLSIHEKELLNILIGSLDYEKITYKIIKNEKKNYVQIIIQNWNNYLKCWKIGIFDRSNRKKNSFVKIAKEVQVYLKITKADLENLQLRFTQSDLAELIGSWQGNVSKMLAGKIFFSKKQIKVLKENNISLGIEQLRIGNLTLLPYDSHTQDLFFK
jgi:hypothetical protein